MIEFLIEFKDQFILFLEFMVPIAVIALMTLGMVGFMGRLLGITKTDRSKNIFAAILLPTLSFFYRLSFGEIEWDYQLIWDILELATFSTIFYLAFCWKLYFRIDEILDKKVGKVDFKPTNKKRERKK